MVDIFTTINFSHTLKTFICFIIHLSGMLDSEFTICITILSTVFYAETSRWRQVTVFIISHLTHSLKLFDKITN